MREHLKFSEEFYDKLTDNFYKELFELIPGAKDLFHNIDRQKSMFTSMTAVLTKSASDPEKLDRLLSDLGIKHANLGVMPMHIRQAHDAFLRAIRESCDDLTDEEEAFFSSAYKGIADKMNFIQKDKEKRT